MENINSNELNKYSIISGKTKKYFPVGIAYVDTQIEKDLENIILVYCYFGKLKNRFFDKVEFYDILTVDDFNKLDKSPLVYILESSKEESKNTLLDLKGSPIFKQ